MYCHGVGLFLDNPKLNKFLENNEEKKFSRFYLTFTRIINNRKEHHKLLCEIWGTAAEYVVTNFKAGDKINILDSIARVINCENSQNVVFRINDFSKSI